MRSMLTDAVAQLAVKNGLSIAHIPVQVEQPRFEKQGDFACPCALALARVLHRSPMDIAEQIAGYIGDLPSEVEKVEVARPGYINVFIKPGAWFDMLEGLLNDPARFITSDVGDDMSVLIEFVSANPTGPLHVGHARGAILGDALARVMAAAGFAVHKEYYLNDRGNQIAALGRSVHVRGRQQHGYDDELPENAYKGKYLIDIAKRIMESPDAIGFKLQYETLGEPDSNPLATTASRMLQEEIKKDLEDLDIRFDNWFSERSLYREKRVEQVLTRLQGKGLLYELQDGAVMFRSTAFGDDQDRVVIRSNKQPTYFASDIAYHDQKFRRGLDRLINIWGADHHGYIPRMHAAMKALGYDPEKLEIILVQMVSLVQGGKPVTMGKRSGDYYTLRQLVEEVGKDAVRFIFLTRKADAQMEFDIQLARSRSLENPVYYVQYGHARLRSIIAKAELSIDDIEFRPELSRFLQHPEEQQLIKKAAMFPFTVEQAALTRQPHLVAFTLMDMVKTFHSYYTRYKNTDKVLSRDPDKRAARLVMTAALARIIKEGLNLVGVSAPEVMNREP